MIGLPSCFAFPDKDQRNISPTTGVHTTDFDWGTWWGYDGISGPSFWGVINRGWRLCSDGRRQSPVNLATEAVVFDHTLAPIVMDGNEVCE
ncbi:hypothetical protein HAZT_HAZT009331 [Hyalella azteca]|uniref:Alpha-carbonic anhydrase domain-containing protein n=1 Tax=Hyalella azteca TaxID=294128 RepID=A0A6A0H0C4_HYAAZ|nr:hypothetical protein HAZT_HAZT009331 [Hyalella azteca]